MRRRAGSAHNAEGLASAFGSQPLQLPLQILGGRKRLPGPWLRPRSVRSAGERNRGTALYSAWCCTMDSSDVSTSAGLPSIRRGMASS